MLNTLWGKLAQRPNQPKTTVVKSYKEMWNLFSNKNIEILGDIGIGEMLLFTWRYVDVANAKPGNTAVAIASFVTA